MRNGRKDDRQESGNGAAEPGAAHDGAKEKEDKRVGDHMLQWEGPDKRNKTKQTAMAHGLTAFSMIQRESRSNAVSAILASYTGKYWKLARKGIRIAFFFDDY